ADEPTCGRLAESQFLTSPATIALTEMFCPLVEPELTFLFDEDLTPNASFDEIIAKSRVAAGFEIPESRYAGWFPVAEQSVTDLVADNSYAGVVVHSTDYVPASSLDLSGVECRMTIDGELFGVGHGTDVFGHPARPIVWLSKKLA